MSDLGVRRDAIVIGGGFYGATIAVYLARMRGLKHITLLEREPTLFSRASYNNQARVHNGYHYPRSFTTAHRSRVNLPKFVRDWPDAIETNLTKLYAIARRNSKVTARQFQRFCADIGAELHPADPELRNLFESSLIEEVFLVKEYVFDSTVLAAEARVELQNHDVEVCTETSATAISSGSDGLATVQIRSKNGSESSMSSSYVFNCTYSGLNQLAGDFRGVRLGLKHELTEMALLRVPAALEGIGVTVMDGPFFSILPFPPVGLHTLSHVRYTPHAHWEDRPGVDPYAKLEAYDRSSRADRMIRDTARFLPLVADAEYVNSLFEVKTVLSKSEGDDGRPILFERHATVPGCYSILGGKIDNIYDIIEKLDAEQFSVA